MKVKRKPISIPGCKYQTTFLRLTQIFYTTAAAALFCRQSLITSRITKMSADVPLLSDYKRKFVRNRLCQTLLGGIRVFGVPWYTIPLQIILFCVPLVAVIPFSLIGT